MRIAEAKPEPPYRVFLRFDDGTAGTVDLSHLAGRGIFAMLSQPGIFEQLFVTDIGALAWPGDVDLCPDALYLQMTAKDAGNVFPVLRPALAHA